LSTPVAASQGLVDGVEVRGQQQPAPLRQRIGQGAGAVVSVDAQLLDEDLQRPGRGDPEHRGVGADEHPAPPAVAVFALDRGVHLPAGLIHVQVPGGGVPLRDQLGQRGQQLRTRREHPGQGALGDMEPVVGQRGHDAVRGTTQHELLTQQPGQEPTGEPTLPDRLGYRCGDQDPTDRAATRPPVGRAPVHDPGQLHLPVDLLTTLLPEPGVARAAERAHPLGLTDVVDLLTGR